jgi:Zn-dependent protease with chaperone function
MQGLKKVLGASRLGQALVHPATRLALRATRTVALVGTVSFASYSSGVHDALADADGQTEQILKKVLMSTGGASTLEPDAPDARLVARLGNELVLAAQEWLSHELEALEAKSAGGTGDGGSDVHAERQRLQMQLRTMRRQWRFVVIDDPEVQAFVTDVLPGFVFVHRGLIELMRGAPAQLSFVLGHELSHHVLEHNEQARHLQRGFSLLQLLVLATVDPTGLVSLVAFELGALGALLSIGVALPFSRTHESEADALALQLVVRSCRDPAAAIQALAALAALEEAAGAPAMGGLGTWLGALIVSHPPTHERFERLRALLPAAEAEYRRQGCEQRKTQLGQLWRATHSWQRVSRVAP